MVAPVLKAAASYAGKYLLKKGKKAALKLGVKAVKKGSKAVAQKTGITFSHNKGDQGAVNMVKKDMTNPHKPLKATLSSAYQPKGMKMSKSAAAIGLGGPAYAQKKIMQTQRALGYGGKATMKTRR